MWNPAIQPHCKAFNDEPCVLVCKWCEEEVALHSPCCVLSWRCLTAAVISRGSLSTAVSRCFFLSSTLTGCTLRETRETGVFKYCMWCCFTGNYAAKDAVFWTSREGFGLIILPGLRAIVCIYSFIFCLKWLSSSLVERKIGHCLTF